MTKPLPCPFCGKLPLLAPLSPSKDGNAWGTVECVNELCAVKPSCGDGILSADDRGSEAYKEAAILRWNERA